MRKVIAVFLCLLIIFSLTAGCGEKTPEYELETEFTLPIGEEASIKGEDLKIEFIEVLEDSRCPKNVECIWAGQARYAVTFKRGDASEQAIFTEPGENGQSKVTVFDYEVRAALEPYPEEPDSVATDEYQVRMSVKKLSPSAYDLKEQADIYATVIRQLYEIDHTFGSNPPDFPNLYLVYMTDDSVGGGLQGPPSSQVLPESLRIDIADRLSDLPAEIKWVSSFEEVPLEENRIVEGGGVVIRVGNINKGESDTVLVAGSIYIANLAAGGQTYVLVKQAGTWHIIGTSGPVWIS